MLLLHQKIGKLIKVVLDQDTLGIIPVHMGSLRRKFEF
jgi:hypothetical protein